MINLSSFRTYELVMIVLIIMGVCFLFKELYISTHHGILLIKAGERRNLAVAWMVIFVLWSFFLAKDIKGYMPYKELFYKDSILNHILWMEVSILNVFGAIRYSEIRENGIYFFSLFP